MTIQLGRITPVNQREGYSDTINPSGFVNAYSGTIQAGQQLQNLGARASDFFAKQQVIENDNFVNNQLLDFEKEKVKQLNYLTTDPKAREKLSPSQYGQYITEKLTTFRSKQLTKIPPRRLEGFKINTEQSLMAAQASALKQMKKVNDDEYDQGTLRMGEVILENASNPSPAWDKQTALNSFSSRVANGVVANVYDEAGAFKKLDKFKEDLADTDWNRRESEALNNSETTLDQIMLLGKEMAEDPDLDPKMKFRRAESLLTRFNTRQSGQRALLEDLAAEKESKIIAGLFKKMSTKRREKKTLKYPTITHEDIDIAIKDGLRDKMVIKQMTEIANRQEDFKNFGDEDNEPDAGYLDDIKKIELKALRNGLTNEQFDEQLLAITTKARKDGSMTSAELTKIDDAITTVTKDFKDEGKKNFKDQTMQVRQAIRKLYGGSDQFLKQYNDVRENLIADAYTTARLLIKGGERWDVAFEKIKPLVTEVTAVGIQRFRGVSAKDLVIKARNGKIDDNDRFVLEAMAARRREREKQKPDISKDLGLKNK